MLASSMGGGSPALAADVGVLRTLETWTVSGDADRFVTDTATLCVCDPAALEHRLTDECDWWSDPTEELKEVNSATIAFFALGADGQYEVLVSPLPPAAAGARAELVLSVPEGRLFIGAGEEAPGAGAEPACARGGLFMDLTPGVYLLQALRSGPDQITLWLEPSTASPRNHFAEPLVLF